MRLPLALVWIAGCNPDPADGDSKPGGGDPTGPQAQNPGYKPLARLNATEYDTTARDLFGTSEQPGRNFPPDEIAYGFDNVAEALTTTGTHVELWESAADLLLDEMFGRNIESTVDYGVQAEAAGVTYLGTGQLYGDDAYALFDGSLSTPFSLEYDGTFEITVGAFGRPDGTTEPMMEVRVDGEAVGSFEVTNGQGDVEDFVVTLSLPIGLHTFEVAIVNPIPDSQLALMVDYLKVRGPTDPETGRTAAYDRFVPCAVDGLPERGCAADALAAFGRVAWRRPLTVDDADWALSLYDAAILAELDQGEALQYAFKGLLMSPEFLYRPERDPAQGDPFVQLDGYEVATRLAAFAWSSAPDEALLDAAEAGELDTPEGVAAELVRMLEDERGEALVNNLAAQWFAVRKLDGTSLDVALYPAWDAELRASMQHELTTQLRRFFREGAPLEDLVLGQSTQVDARLAEIYRLSENPAPGEWVDVSTVGLDRYGVFGTAGWLAATSRADGPSAVRRGKWVLDNLLCAPPPPPPPNVENMLEILPDEGSVREQEEAIRSDEFCQTCHSQMDPIGFALNGFDAVGASRALDELGYTIDDETVFNGTPLGGARDLAELVASDPGFARCVVEKTFTYALGRSPTIDDGEAVEAMTSSFVDDGQTFEALARAIVNSDAFRFRGAPPEVK